MKKILFTSSIFLISLVFNFRPLGAFAADPSCVYTPPYTIPQVNGFDVNGDPIMISPAQDIDGTASGNSGLGWINNTSAFLSIPDWHLTVDKNGTIVTNSCSIGGLITNNASITTNTDSDINGFCSAVTSCNLVSNNSVASICSCLNGIAKSYDQKAIDTRKAQINSKIKNSGVDSTKGSDAISSCGADLACVSSILSGISGDSAFSQSTTISGSGPLTFSDAQNLMNSNTGTADVSNSATSAGSAASFLGKQPGPTVQLTFSSDGGMKDGSKVTATAIPSAFANASDPKNLYFTWYLKRSGCEKDSNPSVEKKSRCDLDGNEKVDENDWKIDAAMMTLRASGFDKSEVDYTKEPNGFNEDLAGVESNPKVTQSDSDKSGWIKTIDSNLDNGLSDKVPNCYVQDPKSGLTYELRDTSSNINPCPDGYYQACVNNIKANTIGCDTLVSDCRDTNCQTTNSGGANYVDPLKGLTSYNTIPFDMCANTNAGTINNDFTCTTNDNIIGDYKTNVTCEDSSGNKTGEAVCLKKDDSNTNIIDSTNAVVGTIFGLNKIVNKGDAFCSTMFDSNSLNWTIPPAIFPNWLSTLKSTYIEFNSVNQKCSTLVDELVNGTKNSSGVSDIAGNNKNKANCSFKKDVNLCKHLFPVYKSGLDLKNSNGTTDAKIGDGKFSFDEKVFWGADPIKSSTNGEIKDEAAIMGLGVNNLAWTYNQGDEIGVAVEGQSMFPADHNDASYKIMWAFSKGNCSAWENLSKASSTSTNAGIKQGKKSFYIDELNGKGIFATDIDLNDCLEENLIDPQDNNLVDNNFKLNLSVSPNNDFTNDPTDGSGTQITVSSLPTNTSGINSLMYDWHIELSMDGDAAPGDNTQWKDITTNLSNLIDHTAFSGIGKSEIIFSLNIPSSIVSVKDNSFYLRIKAKANENIGANSQKAIESTSALKIYQQKTKLLIYPVIADASGILSLDKGTTTNSKELCSGKENQEDKINCGVTKNEIMGVVLQNSDIESTLANISWKVNGNEIHCDANISQACSNPIGNVLFFPILGNEGEAISLQAIGTSTNADAVADNITISRNFIIVKPAVQIVSADSKTAWAKIMGFYKDLDGNLFPDYGTGSMFESSPGYKIQLQANFYPAWKEAQADYTWTINGEKQEAFSNTKTIAFNTEGLVGDSYAINLNAIYKPGISSQVNNLRKALLKNWNINMTDVEETNESASVQINLVTDTKNVTPESIDAPWGANILSHIPEQTLFLFRIILSAFILLFSTGIVFAVIPESPFEKKS